MLEMDKNLEFNFECSSCVNLWSYRTGCSSSVMRKVTEAQTPAEVNSSAAKARGESFRIVGHGVRPVSQASCEGSRGACASLGEGKHFAESGAVM